MRIFLVVLLLLFSSSDAFACYVHPKEQSVPVDELIDRTENIVLAKVIKIEYLEKPDEPIETTDIVTIPGSKIEKPIRYYFKVVEAYKGHQKDSFFIDGFVTMQEHNHFNHHKDGEFWGDDSGRLYHHPDCQIHPDFFIGGLYLIFLNEPYHQKSFEYVGYGSHVYDDDWLKYVKKVLGKSDE